VDELLSWMRGLLERFRTRTVYVWIIQPDESSHDTILGVFGDAEAPAPTPTDGYGVTFWIAHPLWWMWCLGSLLSASSQRSACARTQPPGHDLPTTW
jgi:hypothetical protein